MSSKKPSNGEENADTGAAKAAANGPVSGDEGGGGAGPLGVIASPAATPQAALVSMDNNAVLPEPQKGTHAETSPQGRYLRFEEKLGSGQYKDVYRAYDTSEGIEVAWNTVNIKLLPKDEKKRIMNEVRLLQNLEHKNLVQFHGSWVNREKEQVIFVTEIVVNGSLKDFINKVELIRWKVVKRWVRQILRGLHYLHTRDTPIIHRDLKCDNIFINGHTGDIRIGDLGLSTSSTRTDKTMSVLGTPEFMAPELYDESYNEKVDIYAFGMCMLEMITKERPYSECNNAAQIYKRVTSAVLPSVLERVHSRQAVDFIRMCLDFDPAKRPSAADLLLHPFLADKNEEEDNEEVKLNPPADSSSSGGSGGASATANNSSNSSTSSSGLGGSTAQLLEAAAAAVVHLPDVPHPAQRGAPNLCTIEEGAPSETRSRFSSTGSAADVSDYYNGTSAGGDATGSTRSDLSTAEGNNSSGAASPVDTAPSAPPAGADAVAVGTATEPVSAAPATAGQLMRPRSFSFGFNSGSGTPAGAGSSAGSSAPPSARGRPYEAPFQSGDGGGSCSEEPSRSGSAAVAGGTGESSDNEHEHEQLLAQMPDWESNMKDLNLPEGRAEREEEDDTEGGREREQERDRERAEGRERDRDAQAAVTAARAASIAAAKSSSGSVSGIAAAVEAAQRRPKTPSEAMPPAAPQLQQSRSLSPGAGEHGLAGESSSSAADSLGAEQSFLYSSSAPAAVAPIAAMATRPRPRTSVSVQDFGLTGSEDSGSNGASRKSTGESVTSTHRKRGSLSAFQSSPGSLNTQGQGQAPLAPYSNGDSDEQQQQQYQWQRPPLSRGGSSNLGPAVGEESAAQEAGADSEEDPDARGTQIDYASSQGTERDMMRLVMHTHVEGRLQEVEFDFNLDKDSAMEVAGEMIRELKLPGHELDQITQTIKALAEKARKRRMRRTPSNQLMPPAGMGPPGNSFSSTSAAEDSSPPASAQQQHMLQQQQQYHSQQQQQQPKKHRHHHSQPAVLQQHHAHMQQQMGGGNTYQQQQPSQQASALQQQQQQGGLSLSSSSVTVPLSEQQQKLQQQQQQHSLSAPSLASLSSSAHSNSNNVGGAAAGSAAPNSTTTAAGGAAGSSTASGAAANTGGTAAGAVAPAAAAAGAGAGAGSSSTAATAAGAANSSEKAEPYATGLLWDSVGGGAGVELEEDDDSSNSDADMEGDSEYARTRELHKKKMRQAQKVYESRQTSLNKAFSECLEENRRQQEKFRKDCEEFERKKVKMESEFDIRIADLKTEWRAIEGRRKQTRKDAKQAMQGLLKGYQSLPGSMLSRDDSQQQQQQGDAAAKSTNSTAATAGGGNAAVGGAAAPAALLKGAAGISSSTKHDGSSAAVGANSSNAENDSPTPLQQQQHRPPPPQQQAHPPQHQLQQQQQHQHERKQSSGRERIETL